MRFGGEGMARMELGMGWEHQQGGEHAQVLCGSTKHPATMAAWVCIIIPATLCLLTFFSPFFPFHFVLLALAEPL